MKFKKNIAILFAFLFIFIFVLSGCSPYYPPHVQLTVYKGSCHVLGNDVYFAYNGEALVAKNQLTGYLTQSKQSGIDIIVIQLQDGSFIIPNK